MQSFLRAIRCRILESGALKQTQGISYTRRVSCWCCRLSHKLEKLRAKLEISSSYLSLEVSEQCLPAYSRRCVSSAGLIPQECSPQTQLRVRWLRYLRSLQEIIWDSSLKLCTCAPSFEVLNLVMILSLKLQSLYSYNLEKLLKVWSQGGCWLLTPPQTHTSRQPMGQGCRVTPTSPESCCWAARSQKWFT